MKEKTIEMRKTSIVMIALLIAGLFALPVVLADGSSSKIGVTARVISSNQPSVTVSAEDVAKKTGFSSSDVKEKLNEINELTKEESPKGSIVISIYFWGKEAKGFLIERRAAEILENGEATLDINREYRGIIKTAKGGSYSVKGDDISSLSLFVESKEVGEARIDAKKMLLKIDLKSEEKQTYSLTDIERRPVSPATIRETKTDSGEIVSLKPDKSGSTDVTVSTDEKPFLKKLFTKDEATEKRPSEVDESKSQVTFWQRIRKFFIRSR